MNWLKRNWKKILTGFVILLAFAAAYIFFPVHEDLSHLKERAANYDVKTLRDTYSALQEDDRLKITDGDSYVLLAIWDKEGKVSSMSIHQFGSATLHPESPHYADQSPLMANRQLKPVWSDEADIRANLEREYAPGKE